jgi:ribulose-5-phosphate 4-epimerase/fuculose-1-phosphate aldolase
VSETGVVKFTCDHVASEVREFNGFAGLYECRSKLRQLGLVGVDANGIGFGNISVRDADTAAFFITGSGTGAKAELEPRDCARVTAYDFDKNWLRCEGGIVASSESLTHAAIYEALPDARGVIHCHSLELWSALLDQGPATSRDVEYGTPEMAREVRRLVRETAVRRTKRFAMAGHPEGVIAFGFDLDDALSPLVLMDG